MSSGYVGIAWVVGAALLAATPAPALAQRMDVQAKGGLVVSDLAWARAGDQGARSSFGGGAALRIGVIGPFSIQPEMLYMPKGGGGDEGGWDFAYLEMPILVRFDFELGPLPAHVHVGPAPAFELSCRQRSEVEGRRISIDCDRFGTDFDRRKLDLGVAAGGGAAAALGRGSLTLEARFTRGLLDILHGRDQLWHWSAAGLLGYTLPLGGG